MQNEQQKTFITNKEQLLSDVINHVLPLSHSLDMLVGYFYFSGYQLLYEQLHDKPVRVLVGMDIDTTITNTFQEIVLQSNTRPSRNQVREEYYASLIQVINESNIIDTLEGQRTFKQFLEKLENGTLEIRKTDEPCHAKIYIFTYDALHNEKGNTPGTVITGSSNLSYAGLQGRYEINVRCRDLYAYEDANRVFEDLWRSAIPVASLKELPTFQDLVVKHIWYDKLFPPFIIFLRVLHEYFNIPSKDNMLTPHDITRGKYYNLKYQTDAVQMALQAVENHRGVIISDVVGLGKSIIASTVAKNLGLRTIVIAPPHLCPQWEDYMEQFDLRGKVFSSGKMEEPLNFYRKNSLGQEYTIIVDEAHRYRNEYTESYAMLHDLCLGNKVLLLTATPFNNKPEDILAMLKLFQVPAASTLNTVDNLGEAFRLLIMEYKQLTLDKKKKKLSEEKEKKQINRIAQTIRSIISPIVVRRSRIDLMEIPEYREDLKRQGIEMIIPEPPIELNYDLGEEYHKIYRNTLRKIAPSEEERLYNKNCFKATRYAPITYVKTECRKEVQNKLLMEYDIEVNLLIGGQMNTAHFMKQLLVSRFESSVYALQQSLNYMISSYENIMNWIDKVKKVPIYKKGYLPNVDDFYESTVDGFSEIDDVFEKYKERGFFTIETKYLKEDYENDLDNDLKILKEIREEWFGDDKSIRVDPKLDDFKKKIVSMLQKEPHRKIVVFSGYADTVNYLGEQLQDLHDEQGNRIGVFKYTGQDSSPKNKEIIIRNFDAGISKKQQLNDYQVLIATDAIAEGYNLHRAGAIFNYDIPYNPTRVIQRIGRINRINKKVFDKLYIYNYFPSRIGEAETRTKEISTLKMAMIHAIMGEDTKVLTKDEEVQAFFIQRYKEEMGKTEVESWDSKYRKLLNQMKGSAAYTQALQIPYRARTGRKVQKEKNGVIVLGKKGNDYIFKFKAKKNDDVITLPIEEALALFEAEENELPVELTQNFHSEYQEIKNHLFYRFSHNIKDKKISSAIGKIEVMKKDLDNDYLNDLRRVLKTDALSGYEVRLINKLIAADFKELPQLIEQDYLDRIIHMKNNVEGGKEILILSEEIQS